jgi:hypothetical protein
VLRERLHGGWSDPLQAKAGYQLVSPHDMEKNERLKRQSTKVSKASTGALQSVSSFAKQALALVTHAGTDDDNNDKGKDKATAAASAGAMATADAGSKGPGGAHVLDQVGVSTVFLFFFVSCFCQSRLLLSIVTFPCYQTLTLHSLHLTLPQAHDDQLAVMRLLSIITFRICYRTLTSVFTLFFFFYNSFLTPGARRPACGGARIA